MTPSPQKIESPDTPGGFTRVFLELGQRSGLFEGQLGVLADRLLGDVGACDLLRSGNFGL